MSISYYKRIYKIIKKVICIENKNEKIIEIKKY